MSDPFATPADLLTHVWARFGDGVRHAGDPFRIVCLATCGVNGPEARMVGLRRADRGSGEIEVHSDRRTAKCRALEADPRATLLAWDPAAQLQVRVGLDMRMVASDPVRWTSIPEAARLNYGTDPAPGDAVPHPDDVTRRVDIARFVALIGRVRTIDIVSLAHDPHRRVFCDAEGCRWVAP